LTGGVLRAISYIVFGYSLAFGPECHPGRLIATDLIWLVWFAIRCLPAR
jgi:hypothetical protein